MPKTHVSHTIGINCPPEKVFEKIADFKQWPGWSPWLILEPGAELSFSEDGRSYEWEGELIGAGTLRKIEEDPGNRLRCRLEILKPWKSASDVTFLLEPGGEGTQLTWQMDGKLPLLMFWMKAMMETIVGMDYNRGLNMLKDLCETGSVPNKIEALGEESFPGKKYVGVTTACKIPEIGEKMGADFQRLEPWVNEQKLDGDNPPFSIYEKWNMSKSDVRYSVGIPVEEIPDSLPEDFVSGEIPAGKIFVVKHTGPYRHLGNAWALGMMLSRNKTFRPRKGAWPFELYVSDPRKTDENDLIVHICFPML